MYTSQNAGLTKDGKRKTFDYTFDTNTGASDPGSGDVKVNNGTQRSATAIYISQNINKGDILVKIGTKIKKQLPIIKGN